VKELAGCSTVSQNRVQFDNITEEPRISTRISNPDPISNLQSPISAFVPKELKITTPSGAVSALVDAAARPAFVYVLAHGAGAGMRHPALAGFAKALADRGAATLRYNFPYMEAGKGGVDRPPVAQATVRAAVAKAGELFPRLPIIAGGRSFGGRMTSGAQSAEPLEGVRGLAFLAFPLHAPGKAGVERADHLDQIKVPMLFLQGSKDQFAQLDLLEQVVKRFGKRAELLLIPGGDHSFKAPKGSGTPAEIEGQLADRLVAWAKSLK
jgi:predicted alpha/beta-hydrolase family hydrolase